MSFGRVPKDCSFTSSSVGHSVAELSSIDSLGVGASRVGIGAVNVSDNYYINGVGVYFTQTVIVAGLPAAASSVAMQYFVTDATVAASGNFGATVAGGGANVVPVFSDGTNWVNG